MLGDASTTAQVHPARLTRALLAAAERQAGTSVVMGTVTNIVLGGVRGDDQCVEGAHHSPSHGRAHVPARRGPPAMSCPPAAHPLHQRPSPPRMQGGGGGVYYFEVAVMAGARGAASPVGRGGGWPLDRAVGMPELETG